MLFENIIGLEDIKATLLKSVKNGHIAHAQLFLGNEGSANLALALAYAQYINCENPQENDSCGSCSSCYKIQKLIHPDLHFVFPVTVTKKVTKDPLSENFLPDWRAFLLRHPYGNLSDWLGIIGAENKQPNISAEESRKVIQNLSLKTFEANYKIMLIWQPEVFNLTAANVLLKILEEPPPNTIFILVGNNVESMLTTILSRTQLVKIRDYTDREVEDNLQKLISEDLEKVKKISFLSNGNINLALKLNEDITDENHTFFAQWLRFCYGFKVDELLRYSDKFHSMSKDEQKSTLEYGLQIFRECLISLAGEADLVRLPDDIKAFVQNLSKQMNFDKLEFFYKEFNKSIYHLERNANPRILFLDISIKVAQVIKNK